MSYSGVKKAYRSYFKKKYGPPSSSSSRRGMANFASGTAGLIAGGPIAGQVAIIGSNALMDYVEAEEVSSTKMSRSSGFYKGSIKRAKHAKKTVEQLALQKGFHVVNDTYGRVADGQGVYLMHSTWSATHMTTAIVGALTRKLFAKAGIQINERSEELPLASLVSALGFRIEFTHQNAVNAAGNTTNYDTVEDDTLQSVINNLAGPIGYFANYLSNTGGVLSEPYRMSLYSLDGALWRLAATLNLQNEYLNIFISSELNFQNRTNGDLAAAGDANIERVDNQPLIGKMYEFGNSDPRLRQNSSVTDPLNTSGLNGIKLIRAVDLTGGIIGSTFQHRPSPKIWANCKGTSQFILDPGNLKKTFVSWKASGLLVNILKKLKTTTVGGGGVSGAPGKCQIVMLEEKLRTAGTNLVTVQYEHVHKVGCWFTTKQGGSLHSNYNELAYNLV